MNYDRVLFTFFSLTWAMLCFVAELIDFMISPSYKSYLPSYFINIMAYPILISMGLLIIIMLIDL